MTPTLLSALTLGIPKSLPFCRAGLWPPANLQLFSPDGDFLYTLAVGSDVLFDDVAASDSGFFVVVSNRENGLPIRPVSGVAGCISLDLSG